MTRILLSRFPLLLARGYIPFPFGDEMLSGVKLGLTSPRAKSRSRIAVKSIALGAFSCHWFSGKRSVATLSPLTLTFDVLATSVLYEADPRHAPILIRPTDSCRSRASTLEFRLRLGQNFQAAVVP